MTKKDFMKLLETAIGERKGFSFVSIGPGTIRVYHDVDVFTAYFITDVVEKTGNYFTGITNDADGKVYMLFNY